MPRSQSFTSASISERALPVFWRNGFVGTSIEDLTRAVGASRHAIYSAFADKRALLVGCIETYRRSIVDPAFSVVEEEGAGLDAIAIYFEMQIVAAEQAGLPGDGCLLANLTTEIAPHDPEVTEAVQAHLARLRLGFAQALRNAPGHFTDVQVDGLAALLATAAQGLWSVARVTDDAADLRRPVAALLQLIEGAVTKCP